MTREPTITCHGDDGETVFRYYALCGPTTDPEHVGWVLVLDGPHALAPQYVTPTEIVGDLASMGIEDAGMHHLVRSGTEDMLAQLRAHVKQAGDDTTAAELIAELARELAALPEP